MAEKCKSLSSYVTAYGIGEIVKIGILLVGCLLLIFFDDSSFSQILWSVGILNVPATIDCVSLFRKPEELVAQSFRRFHIAVLIALASSFVFIILLLGIYLKDPNAKVQMGYILFPREVILLRSFSILAVLCGFLRLVYAVIEHKQYNEQHKHKRS